ncbi:two-component system response regulator [Vibrio breoganii]|uniref:response regulator transcription factor n=1 Tax=Vibrio breoganii TaxID=553239 RepID=UPI000C831AD8|nr:response regulator transcription factor [Vibrio breoganii]PMG33315.1 two-component system response regulator [Vibrio breoganii]
MNTEKLQLLLVEDDLDLAKAIIDYLELEDILCDHAANGVAGFTLINQSPYDAVILDLNLPKMNGLEVCEKLRSLGIDVPILMLTARDTLDDKLTGFSKGTDDYLVKPFAMAELIVRVQALSRRKSGQTTILKVEGVELAPQTQTATRDGAELKLTPITMKLLKTLMRESPNTVSREKLMQSVWGDEKPDSNSLKVHMHNLRKAIDNRGERKLIHTIARRGFAFKREDKI